MRATNRHQPLLSLLLLLALAALAGCSSQRQPPPEPPAPAAPSPGLPPMPLSDGPNLVICVLDAARADRLGCYGCRRPTTPNLDRLAEESLLFENHFTQATETKLSTASLFTSQYVDTHRAFGDVPLPESGLTIPAAFGAAGFQTALFSSNLQASPAYGIGPEFGEVYWAPDLQALTHPGETAHSAEVLLRAFEPWLGTVGDTPFFAYLHFLPPHQPYEAPGEFADLFTGRRPPGYRAADYHPGAYEFPLTPPDDQREPPPLPEWINLYDANLRRADWAVGEVIRLLRQSDLLDDTILLVTSDHGEAFGEHGFIWHSPAIHDEATRIPLLIRLPHGDRAARVSPLTQTIDLLPTLFDFLDLPYPADRIQGRSLLPLIDGEADSVNDYVFTRSRGSDRNDKYMMRGEDHALLLFGNGEWRALYDLRADPGQTRNIIDEQPDIARDMLGVFETFVGDQAVPPKNFLHPRAPAPATPDSRPSRLTPDLRRELRSLGYLE